MEFTGSFALDDARTYKAAFTAHAEPIICTYAIECRDDRSEGRAYIGSTVHMFRRWMHHVQRLRGGRHENADLQALFRKYGADAFSIRILTHYKSSADLFGHEVKDGLAFCSESDMINRRLGNDWINGWSPMAGEYRNSPPRRRRMH